MAVVYIHTHTHMYIYKYMCVCSCFYFLLFHISITARRRTAFRWWCGGGGRAQVRQCRRRCGPTPSGITVQRSRPHGKYRARRVFGYPTPRSAVLFFFFFYVFFRRCFRRRWLFDFRIRFFGSLSTNPFPCTLARFP